MVHQLLGNYRERREGQTTQNREEKGNNIKALICRIWKGDFKYVRRLAALRTQYIKTKEVCWYFL
jgi:hypothetical protein